MKNRANDATDGGHSYQPIFRRPKASPCEDFWHTLHVGVPITIVLFILLPILFRAFI